MGNKRNGLLALLGMGALAFWKYKNMTPEEQENIKGKFNTAKENLKSAGNDLKGTVESKLNEAKAKAEDLKNQAKSEMNDSPSFN